MLTSSREPRGSEPRLVWLAAEDVDGLLAALTSARSGLGPDADARPGRIATRDGVAMGPARLGIVDPDERKLELSRRLVAKGAPWRGRSDIWFTPDGLARRGGRTVFLFPGVEPTFGAEHADLPEVAGRLGLEAPALSTTTLANRSASIYRLGIFLDLVIRRLGVEPDLVAGHSIGEWSGSVAAGMVPRDRAEDVLSALDLDGIDLPDVDFAALGAGAVAVAAALGTADGPDGIEISHDNCPNQSVICGAPELMDRALAHLRSADILGYKLDFQSGFHTPAIAPGLGVFRTHAESLPIGAPHVPMWSATSVAPYPTTREEIVELHLRHLVEPVRFRPLVERLYHDAGARVFVQVGVGSLTNFVDDTLDDDHACVPLLVPKRSALAQLYRAATALWVEGSDVRLDPLRPTARGATAAAPTPAPDVASQPAAPTSTSAPPPTLPAISAREQALAGALDMVRGAAQASLAVIDAVTGRLTPERGTAGGEHWSPAPTVHARPTRARRAAGRTVVHRRLSLETMPETLDHALYEQPAGWDDPSDLFPIVAMTTQIQLLQDIAAELGDGRDVVAVSDVRNLRWLDVSTPLEVEVTVEPEGDDVLQVALGSYCRARVRLGSYPPALSYPPRPLRNARATAHSAREMFDQRLMFHGPRFQGINRLGPIGDDGILGEFHHLSTPGSLLDNMGKLVAYWVMDQRGWKEGPLPIGLDRLELFGPDPAPGVDLACDVRVVDLHEDLVRADGQIVAPDGTVWCRVEGWMSHIFHLDDKTEPLYRAPSRSFVTEGQPGGWCVVRERWPGGAAREFTARRFLRRSERERYEQLNLLEQRRWLIRRVAAVDAVRQWLWDRFGTPSYPVEIVLVPDGEGRFRVESHHVPRGHDPRVTISSLDWLAVAVLGDGEHRDVEVEEVGPGAEPAAASRRVTAALTARNPGARVEAALPDDLETATGRPVAVAWTC